MATPQTTLRRLKLGATVTSFFLGLSSAHAWTLTCINGTSWSLDGGPFSSTKRSVNIPNLNTGPRIYFCIERPTNAGNNESASAKLVSAITSTASIWSGKQIGAWQKVLNTTDACTFNGESSQTWPTYVIAEPTSPYNPRQYKIGYRVYGYIEGGGFGSNDQYLSLEASRGVTDTGWIKVTVSDQDLREIQEPDVVANPISYTWGEPSVTINGIADKVPLTAPASYTLTWNPAGAATFSLTGGTGTGAITTTPSGTSKAFTGVAKSTQTYTLSTNGPASISWTISTNQARWEIHRDGVAMTGTGTSGIAGATDNPILAVTQTGTYHLRVNGLDKKAEDEVVTVTPGFLRRSKTVEANITAP
jgi:hypothetical protein